MTTSVDRPAVLRTVHFLAGMVAVGLFLTALVGHAQAVPTTAVADRVPSNAVEAAGPAGATQEVMVSAPTYASQSGTLTAYQFSGGNWHVGVRAHPRRARHQWPVRRPFGG